MFNTVKTLMYYCGQCFLVYIWKGLKRDVMFAVE